MPQNRRSEFVQGADVTLEVYVDGTGPALVVRPTGKVAVAGFTVLSPQPRGIAGSKGAMERVTLHDLAVDYRNH